MHSSKHLDIAIVGGGIGGLALANCLSHVGIPYTLYEKAPQFGEVGAGIGLSESTYTILKNVGLGSDIEQHGCFVRDAIIVNKRARVIRKIPIQNGGFCIHRAELIRILSKRILPAQVRLGRELSDFTDDKDGVELQFKNGENAHHDWVFACDGIHSLFRKRLFPSVRKRYSGQSIWRGIATCTLPPAYQSAYLEFWGDNLRFGIIPLNSEQYYWYACKTAQQGEQDDPTTLRATLKHLYRNYAPEIVQAIDRTDHFIRNDMFDLLPHNEPWHKDRVVFLGDAIHATTPNLAQGGCQAIEDANLLATLVARNGFSSEVFSAYRTLRYMKVRYIVEQSWNLGRVAHQKNKIMEWAVANLFRYLPDRIFQNQYRKLVDLSYLEGELIKK